MLHTQKDIDMVVAKKGDAVISSALKHLESSAYAQTSYKEQTASLKDGYLKRMDYDNWGPDGKIGQYDDYSNYTAAMRDANAAYQLGYGTLMFLFAPSRIESPSTDIAALTTEQGDSANIYNLCGQRLSAAAKGVNIMRGKKYLVR